MVRRNAITEIIYAPRLTLRYYTDLIVPAVRGTSTILNSALKYGTNVKRIVLTSSLVAIRELDPNPRTYDETNWNNAAVTAVETKGSAAGPALFYLASKTLAERAAWEFVEAHKTELKWDLVAINPPWVFGVRRRYPPILPAIVCL
jgi:nucleoside-diphosphate-sugar epimerase